MPHSDALRDLWIYLGDIRLRAMYGQDLLATDVDHEEVERRAGLSIQQIDSALRTSRTGGTVPAIESETKAAYIAELLGGGSYAVSQVTHLYRNFVAETSLLEHLEFGDSMKRQMLDGEDVASVHSTPRADHNQDSDHPQEKLWAYLREISRDRGRDVREQLRRDADEQGFVLGTGLRYSELWPALDPGTPYSNLPILPDSSAVLHLAIAVDATDTQTGHAMELHRLATEKQIEDYGLAVQIGDSTYHFPPTSNKQASPQQWPETEEAIARSFPSEHGPEEGKSPDPKPSTNGSNTIFLCHSSGDKTRVRGLYSRLQKDGFDCWLDEKNLIPGQDWDREIRRAIKAATFILACLSETSISKAGYINKELKFALDRADEQPEGSIFLIPVRFEPCEVPDQLLRIHRVDIFEPDGYDNLLRALRHR